ncbi:MAG: putative permease often clustered with de novo purine synthesis [Myxococcaceae bacterium]|nr:putative permease often clustered with de novo purine synthesis [Myxococcaceae bacterium]
MTDPAPRSARPLRLVAPTAPRRALLPWLGVGVALALAYYFRDLLGLLGAAFAMAYLLDPLVLRLERLRVPRPLAIVLVLTVLAVVFTLTIWFVVPDIVRQLTDLLTSLPRKLRDQWIPSANNLLVSMRQRYRVRIPVTAESWLAQAGVRTDEIARRSLGMVQSAAGVSLSIIEKVVQSVIVAAMAFYLLLDYHRMLDGVVELVPRRAKDDFSRIATKVNDALGRYVRGQALAMLILGTLFAVGLTVLKVPAGAGIGILAGVLTVVPYVGFFIALIVSALLALLDGGTGACLAVVGYMVFVHLVDITFVTPRIVGGSIGLSPVWVILALLAGGKVAGFVGLLAAIPVASVLRVLVGEAVDYYRTTRFYAAVPAPEGAAQAVELTHLEHQLMGGDVALPPPPPIKFDRPLPMASPTSRHTHADGTPDDPTRGE